MFGNDRVETTTCKSDTYNAHQHTKRNQCVTTQTHYVRVAVDIDRIQRKSIDLLSTGESKR